MMRKRQETFFVISVAVLIGTYALPAWAYIDGGTASLIFQALIAGGLAALVVVKQFWVNIKAFLLGLFGRGSTPSEGD